MKIKASIFSPFENLNLNLTIAVSTSTNTRLFFFNRKEIYWACNQPTNLWFSC